jgi:Na+/H+ antiporter NhaD/arsenite permease-like protein
MLAMAGRVGIAAVPLAMTTVWLANTASLLLPVSNLTNLLAADRVALSSLGLAGRMWAPQLAAITVTMACLWGFYWRRDSRTPPAPAPADAARVDVEGGADGGAESGRHYVPPGVHRPGDPVVFRACALACAGFLLAILVADVELWVASATAAAVAVVAFAARERKALRWSLVPWRLLVMVPGMFLVVETVNAHGLHALLSSAVGHDGGALGQFRAAAVGAGLSNVLNNLPVYLAGEGAVPVGNHDQLLALLIGTNAGPVITPWASLATLLWYERCVAYGVRVPVARLMGTGAVLAVSAVAASVAALALTR